MLMHPEGQLPGALGNCPRANLSYKAYTEAYVLGNCPVPFSGMAGMWLSLKKRAKGWQGRLEGFKNSHGPSKMRKLPNK